MIKLLKRYLFRTAPEAVIEDQLYEARRLALDHRAGAEHHAALADMYDLRVKRLERAARQQKSEVVFTKVGEWPSLDQAAGSAS